jgi:subtilisin family serine protease
MYRRSAAQWTAAIAASSLIASGFASTQASASSSSSVSYLVLAKSATQYSALRATAVAAGARITVDLPEIGVFTATSSGAVRARLAADGRTEGTGSEHAMRLTPELAQPNSAPGLRSARLVPTAPAAAGVNTDPAFSFRGLEWDYRRIGAPQAWPTTQGTPAVTIGVADTGLDFTHPELASKVKAVVDITDRNHPNICKQAVGGPSDIQLAKQFGGPVATDWNGHGSWIGGDIAGALNGKGINGIAPGVSLVSLKIGQNCGFGDDVDILSSFVIAARMNLDAVNISFGGYLDRSDPNQNTLWKATARAVAFARSRGTLIVGSAGNEHVRLGPLGKVVSHGLLTGPGAAAADLFGLYETPAGVPGAVVVSSTGNVVVGSSGNCAPGTIGSAADTNATCKPRGDRHQAAGPGTKNQLAYYSNYGSRIDLAGQGGARKFNLPVWDRGGTPGFPYTNEDLTNVYEDFSITSNFATQIPCFTFTKGSGFFPGACYSTIQGTSMAAPHVVAAIALVASAHPGLRGHADQIEGWLKTHAASEHNFTTALNLNDKSPGDLDPTTRCTTGFCHLGGPRISDADAFGAGMVSVAAL